MGVNQAKTNEICGNLKELLRTWGRPLAHSAYALALSHVFWDMQLMSRQQAFTVDDWKIWEPRGSSDCRVHHRAYHERSVPKRHKNMQTLVRPAKKLDHAPCWSNQFAHEDRASHYGTMVLGPSGSGKSIAMYEYLPSVLREKVPEDGPSLLAAVYMTLSEVIGGVIRCS